MVKIFHDNEKILPILVKIFPILTFCCLEIDDVVEEDTAMTKDEHDQEPEVLFTFFISLSRAFSDLSTCRSKCKISWL